jgi:glyoxylase-like metal-dependent hydrolase (beta-lactamase superfamily II)
MPVLAGSLVRRFPGLQVWVHERGAPHLVDPSRLLASAARLYGDDMDRLWGAIEPIPPDSLRVLSGGERLGAFRVAYTPGHASHHVSYLHEDSGEAFTGDVTGVRIGSRGCVLPPTPPPDVDLEAWHGSLDVIESWAPRSLSLTHFGRHDDVGDHLAGMRTRLDEVESMARSMDEVSFGAAIRAIVAEFADAETAAAYAQAMPPDQSWQGLARYLRRREHAP